MIGMVGLLPGEDNIVTQLHRNGLIKQPLISIAGKGSSEIIVRLFKKHF